MIFTQLKLSGAFLIEPERWEDERGFFARGWCQKEFEEHDLVARVAQVNISHNKKKGTLRGMHYQVGPWADTKVVRCTRGTIYDVMVDLRAQSPTHRQWVATQLAASNYKMLYIPEGFAHGFQTLEDDTEVFYLMSQFYAPGFGRGVRFDDAAFGIQWPLPVQVISDQDKNWPDYHS